MLNKCHYSANAGCLGLGLIKRIQGCGVLNAILVKSGSIENAFLQFQILFSERKLQLGYAQSVNNFNLEKLERTVTVF